MRRPTNDRTWAWAAAVAAAFAITAGAPGIAAAATFGADLNNAPNNTTTCGQGAPPLYLYFVGSPSCMYFSGAPGPTPYAPASGTVTAVRVRVGPVTGPMQVVVLRSLYQNNAGDPGHPYFACCFVEHYGPVFEPQANAISTVQTSLSMTEEPTPASNDFTTNAAGDFLALSVLAPNVPVPLFIDNQSGDSGFYPAPSQQTTPAPAQNPTFASTDFFAGQVLINADLDTGGGAGGGAPAGGGGGGAPAGGGGGAPAGGGGPPPVVPQFALPKLTIPVNGSTATLPVQCLLADCNGTLALQNARLAGAARVARSKAKKPKLISYGKVAFSLKAGATGKVSVKLNGAGRALFKHGKKTAKVWANLSFSSGGGSPKSVRVTLRH